MKLLDNTAVKQKIQRISYQIAENNYQHDEIILAGINNSGYSLAKQFEKHLKKIVDTKVSINRIKLNPANPVNHPISIENPIGELRNKAIIIVDDVANTGRTIFYAFKPFIDLLPFKIEVAVLVDRKHKHFPIQVDYVGMSLATTLKDNIRAELSDADNMEVYLD
jgi:pyrimidine operon attenuation protein/uracil phosphoribosyltransferase